MAMERRKEFGRWIKSIRQEKGLTMQQTAELIGWKTPGGLNSLERGVGAIPSAFDFFGKTWMICPKCVAKLTWIMKHKAAFIVEPFRPGIKTA